MLAYSVFAAHLCFRNWRRRTVFVLLALAATILANALRAWGTMVAAEIWGISRAGGIDHIAYGWGFLGLVMLMVLLVGPRGFGWLGCAAAAAVRGLGRVVG